MESRACNGCGCWPASCRFMSCLRRGSCCTCLPSPRPVPPDLPPLVDAPDVPALQQQKMELTSEQLKALIDCVEQEVARLDPANCSSSSQASISQHLGNFIEKWDEKKQSCTSFIESLPKELKTEVVEQGKTFLVPLLTKALGGLQGVQWIGVGFTFLAWSLCNANNFIQNREECIRLLCHSVRLLKHTKEIWELDDNYSPTDHEDLQDSVEIAIRCVIVCSSNLSDHWILRFLKADSVKDAISKLEEECHTATIRNMNVLAKSSAKNAPKPQRQITLKYLDDDIVGEREVEEDAVTFLEADSQDRMKALLLHGMGGIGKSFQGLRIFIHFQENSTVAYQACRVELLSFETKDGDLVRIQNEIIENVSGNASNFSNLTDGMQHMEKELQQISQPIFLYVDNLLEGYLSKLLPKASFFPKGSRLLITAREEYTARRLLNDLGISDESYKAIEVRRLPEQEAQQLLRSKGKFRIDSEIESAEKRVLALAEEKKVLDLCKGLPLALVVVGSYIAASEEGFENVKVWHNIVENMKIAVPLDGGAKDELYYRLGFSIQNLDEELKRAFLDVVFFLRVSSWWIRRSCLKTVKRLVGEEHLALLSKRALVQIDEKRRTVEMHDVFKAMGNRMVKYDQCKLRISETEEFNELDSSALNKVVALSRVRDVNALRLEQMPHLRLLSDVHVMEECNGIQLRELRVVVGLRCRTARVCNWAKCDSLKEVAWKGNIYRGRPCTMRPDVSNLKVFKHDNLSKTLEALSLDNWTQLKDVQVIVMLTCLRELELMKCHKIQSLPEEILQLTALEQLSLRGCRGLKCLPRGISMLLCLEGLNLSGCESVQSLPDGLTCLTGLTQLDLDECKNLQSIPEGIASLTGLTQLGLRGCGSLQSIPEGIASLTGLTQLGLWGCGSLQSIPEGIASLTGLTQLGLGCCRSLQSIPEGIASLTGVTKLDLRECGSLQSIPEGIASLTGLTKLSLRGCGSLQSIPEGIASLTGLMQLDLGGCGSLQSIPEGIASLTGLTQLDLGGCESLQSIPEGIAGLPELDLGRCGSLQSIPVGITNIGSCALLRSLDLTDCTSLESLPEAVTRLSNLTSLCLLGCRSLQGLPRGLANSLTGLVELKLGHCKNLDIGPLLEEVSCSMRELRVLQLSECRDFQSLPQAMVTTLSSLQKLSLRGCVQFESLPQGVANWTGLTELDLSGCRKLQSLPEELTTMTAITELDLSGCAGLQSLPPGIFTSLAALERLSLRGCLAGLQREELQGITSLVRLMGLESLDLSECDHLLFLLSQQGPAALRSLLLSGCSSLQRLPEGVAALENLRNLDLSGCRNLQSLSHLPRRAANRLQTLNLEGCGGLDQPLVWDTIASLGSLKSLNLSGWERMQVLPDQIANLTKLKFLDLSGCSNLRSLPENLSRLKTLRLENCQNLENLPPQEL